ncbi:TPA: hypothetical protein ACPJZ5_004653 [Vibrio diabolicus]|uniref:hypothetical protein n=1 Tax=Vibrio TaxID=662 RepID=UPI002553D78A|nr:MULTISPECIES: hypothetical protein [unclassified Vibrio]ELB2967198.1 hypothetical protein [Vibrio parahaemolyticus]MDK9726809.1 hypothetical protein [Vibrio sp. D415a]MDK9747335.1 hypothetical protein [Vibrio sp. D409a]MDK9769290.1 hypothetical protein [Vibrio sp. D417a]MDK9789677.1 hypothetical protein [Vibrio sp. D421a]
MELNERVLLSLVAVFVGWLLAQFTNVANDKLKQRKIKKCLLEELDEIESELNRTLYSYSRTLQIYALKGVELTVPLNLTNHIFKNHYKDAVLGLNKPQRISFQLIHSHIDRINVGIEDLHEIAKSIDKNNQKNDSLSLSDLERWGQKIRAEFHNVAIVVWHIKHHKKNKHSPSLPIGTETHESYVKYVDMVDKKIESLLKDAESLDRDKFMKIYNPENFTKNIL